MGGVACLDGWVWVWVGVGLSGVSVLGGGSLLKSNI